MSASPAPRTNWIRAVTSAVFLACSWTWCIGMYLPIYLIRDFGWPGWVAFAVPNVIGAALVGWVWRRAGSSEAFVARNLGAMRAFSGWTIVFHVVFTGWMLAWISESLLDNWGPGGVAHGLVLVLAMLLGGLGSRAFRVFAVFAFVLSWLCVVGASLTSSTLGLPEATGRLPIPQLALAFPVIALGFLLCPHLDLTLHRVRQEEPGATGTVAFVLGFGGFFLSLIVITLLYAGKMLQGSFSFYIIGHMVIQSLFTMSAHLRELFERGAVFTPPAKDRDSMRRRGALTAFVATLSLIVGIVLSAAVAEGWIEEFVPTALSQRELVYKSFLGAYALVFPAWAWIVCVRWGAGRRLKIGAFALVMLIAGPCVWLGMLHGPIVGAPTGWYWLLPPAVLVAALTPLALRRRSGDAPQAG